MYQYQHIYRTILDDIKPHLCSSFLILNEIQILPKEVNWLIIEHMVDTNDDIVNYKHDENILLFFNIYIIGICLSVTKEIELLENYVDKEALMIIYSMVGYVNGYLVGQRNNNINPFEQNFTTPIIQYTNDLEVFLQLQSEKYDTVINPAKKKVDIKTLKKLKSKKKYIDLIQ